MKKVMTLAVFGLLFFMTVDAANAQWRRHGRRQTRGGEIMIGGGLNMCMESGDAECKKSDPSFGILVAPGFRMSNIFGIYADVTYAALKLDDDDVSDTTYRNLTVMPTARIFSVMPGAELYGGVGAGYSRTTVEADSEYGSVEATWENFLNMKLNVGGAFKVSPTMHLGVNLDYIFNADESGEFCGKLGGEKECRDNESDVEDLLQITGFVKFHF